MSVCLDSSRRPRAGWESGPGNARLLAWGLVAEILLIAATFATAVFGLGPATAYAQDKSKTATESEQVKRISVGSDGIVIERAGGSDTLITDGDSHRDFVIRRKIGGGIVSVDGHGDAVVRVFSDIEIPAGERVKGDVVAVFGSVDVEGQIEGDVVAVMGSVSLKPGSRVGGDAVSVGGVVDHADGVEVGGETVSVGFVPVSWGIPAMSFTLSTILAGWLAAVFLGWLFAVLFPARLLRVATTASRRTAASLLIGLVSLPLVISAVGLLFVTVVGIPLALLLPPTYLLLAFAGQMAATYVLGCKLTGRRLGGGNGMMMPILAGTVLVAAFFLVGAFLFVAPGIARPLALFTVMLGGLLVMGLTAIGTGAFLLSKLGAEPRDIDWNPIGTPSPGATPGLASPPPASV
jgi:hypothetical protein